MMPKRSASPLTPRKKARSNGHSYKTCLLLFSPLHFIARPRPTNECPSPSAPRTSYLILIRSTLLPPCRSQFTHYFCDFLRPYLFQLRAPSVPLSSNCLDFPIAG